MTSISAHYFSAVDYIQALRKADFTQEQAEVIAKIVEQQSQTIHEQQLELESLKAKQLATKGDVREAELRLQKEIKVVVQGEIRGSELRLQKEIKGLEIKMMILYGSGFLILLGVLAKGFHWF